MNPRARRIRRQRRKDRVRDAIAAKEEREAFLRQVRSDSREADRAQARREADAARKAEKKDPNHALRVASQIQTGGALFAQMTRALPKV